MSQPGAHKAVAEPLSQGGGNRRGGRDWTARTRDTALNALRYSRFVTVMKRVLPVTAAALILAIIAYSLVPRQSDKFKLTSEQVGTLANDLAMIKPRLTGSDSKGHPFVITADMAIQDAANVKRATLKNVEADLTMDNNRWMNAMAARGFIDMNKGTLKLNGGIAVYSDDGYEIHTERADVDLRKGLMHGPAAVNGHGPSGAFRSDTFELDRKTQQLVLNGHVQMTLIGGHKK
ncbi:MAG: LPS export ABC transporter periplasmic protein LptC [Alphaproteobacteria bacterium]|nr:LPS export ABC transporter periplasmic protein LptC [Alphaproteobacteria bacterium]MBL7097027.1 LPS export ABC transporter periplasmic protein LptC [Alphaproteobacteria bacterium]